MPPGVNNIVWQVTDIGGNTASCSLTVTVNPTTSIQDLKENGISVYPNPVREKLIIDFGDGESGSVTLSDAGGRIIYENEAAGRLENIEFRELPAGNYQIKVRLGNQLFIRKIRKE